MIRFITWKNDSDISTYCELYFSYLLAIRSIWLQWYRIYMDNFDLSKIVSWKSHIIIVCLRSLMYLGFSDVVSIASWSISWTGKWIINLYAKPKFIFHLDLMLSQCIHQGCVHPIGIYFITQKVCQLCRYMFALYLSRIKWISIDVFEINGSKNPSA